jgi:MoaA/NifB/PqqE/SkfB family radical SAM enzyme
VGDLACSSCNCRIGATEADIYLTYRCSLRCRHCFVGNFLDSVTHFPYELLILLLDQCAAWGMDRINLLGGEPTMHPEFCEVLNEARTRNLGIRVVTNGGRSYLRLLRHSVDLSDVEVSFSLDGATKATHESVRGRGTFEVLLTTLRESHGRCKRRHVIMSLSRSNRHEFESMIDLCVTMGIAGVTVHYVSARGNATSEMALDPAEWLLVAREAKELAERFGIEIRLPSMFRSGLVQRHNCVVRQGSNLMFFPDGRVFLCSLFIDQPDAHTYMWTQDGLLQLSGAERETAICARSELECPAMSVVDQALVQSAERLRLHSTCIFDKEHYGASSPQ